MYCEVHFSVNDFDSDGDITEEGIFLHFGDTRILVAENLDGYKSFCESLSNMAYEISEILGDV